MARQILIVLAALLFTIPASAQVCTQPPANLTHWWPADGNAADVQGEAVVADLEGEHEHRLSLPGRERRRYRATSASALARTSTSCSLLNGPGLTRTAPSGNVPWARCT